MHAGSGEPDDEHTDISQVRDRQTYAVVLLEDRAVQLLPSAGTVTIGRSADAQVSIQHATVSREHAVLDLDAMTLTDLGSRNGTLVGGERLVPLVPVSLATGEPIQVGEVTMFVHRERGSSPALAAPAHDVPLELRLVDETSRAARLGQPFVHVRVHVPATQASAARDVLVDGLRTSDVISEEAPGRFQLLLPALTGERGRPVVQRLVATLERSGVSTQAGVACYPHDGVTAAQLSAHARELAANKRTSAAMDDVMQLSANVADSELTVLVTGETGVGKELVAEMIHRISPRATKPFLRINCAAIAEPLLESELFGHARGAFTGANAPHIGLFEAAEGGTVLLDEIGEMSLRLQASLLRVLEERVVRRVGETETRPVDVRIVGATNRDLAAESAAGRFRLDLYYRISGVTIAIPPLRERRDAIEPIARAFAALAAARARRPTPVFSDDALVALRASAWPGNIRELRNAIERAVLIAGKGRIGAAELGLAAGTRPKLQPTSSAGATIPPPFAGVESSGDGRALSSEVAELERIRILEALERFGGNQTRAARALGMSRTTLVARIEAYALRRPRK